MHIQCSIGRYRLQREILPLRLFFPPCSQLLRASRGRPDQQHLLKQLVQKTLNITKLVFSLYDPLYNICGLMVFVASVLSQVSLVKNNKDGH